MTSRQCYIMGRKEGGCHPPRWGSNTILEIGGGGTRKGKLTVSKFQAKHYLNSEWTSWLGSPPTPTLSAPTLSKVFKNKKWEEPIWPKRSSIFPKQIYSSTTTSTTTKFGKVEVDSCHGGRSRFFVSGQGALLSPNL